MWPELSLPTRINNGILEGMNSIYSICNEEGKRGQITKQFHHNYISKGRKTRVQFTPCKIAKSLFFARKSSLRSDLLEHMKLYFMYNKKMFAYAHIYLCI